MELKFDESNRDLWSQGGGRGPRDLLASAFCTLLLLKTGSQPLYLSSPWMSDFVLFENRFREFDSLFPAMPERTQVRLTDFLARLARTLEVRLITTESETSINFLRRVQNLGVKNIHHRFASDEYHEKGVLAPSFYIEGSMNITFSGVNINGEKITYHHGSGTVGARKIATAYLEYHRKWENLL